MWNYPHVVRALLQHAHADKEVREGHLNMTPLMIACKLGWLEVARVLLEAGADVRAVSSTADDALQYAVKNGHLEIVRLLLAHKARKNRALGKSGQTRVMAAAAAGHTEVLKLLLAAGADASKAAANGMQPVSMAAANGHLDAVTLLVATVPALLTQKFTRGVSPLFTAASKGHLAVVDWLLRAGAPVNLACGEGKHTRVPLIGAVHGGHRDVVERLVAAGADVNAVNGAKLTALMTAASKGDADTAEYLLRAGADVALCEQGALVYAVKGKHMRTIRTVVEAGADVTTPTAMQLAAQMGLLPAVRLLLDAGVDVFAVSVLFRCDKER